MPKPPQSESKNWQTNYSLIERIRNPDDNEAWKEFIDHYERYINYILMRVGYSESDSSELCQEIIVILWKEMPKFIYDRNRGKFRTWLARVIKNQAYRQYRSNKKHRTNLTNEDYKESDIALPNEPELDQIIIDEWDSYIGNLAWESIKTRFRENIQNVFLLHIEEIPPKEIAARCGIKESNVYVYIKRIREHLKNEVDRFNQELL